MAEALVRHVPPGARIAIAYSGGLDSSVLLHVLAGLRGAHAFGLSAVHVHHGLSPHADDWAAWCAENCAALGVSLITERVQLRPDDPSGTEAAARLARHRIFASLDVDCLVTAHHRDDQAETFLLQALRGAGPKGLAAMAQCQRPRGWRAMQLRPLLALSRMDLHAAARDLGLRWVEDESNLSDRYRRNALRLTVMPPLRAFFPGCDATLARAAAHQAETAALLDELAQIDATAALTRTPAGLRLDCRALAALSPARARNLLRYFIAQHGVTLPNARRLDEARQQLGAARHDARVRVELGNAALWGWRGGVYMVATGKLPEPVRWRGESELKLPGLGELVFRAAIGQGLRQASLAAGTVVLGCRRGGERLRLRPGGPTHSLKSLLQTNGVPPWVRPHLPVLTCGDTTIWAEGLGCHADWLAGPAEAGWIPLWRMA
ncbi:MAG: tRNA lysidine(34) synthetase TilS [Hydrogenophilales bacterium 16-64-46]|nr:MAG: tRNA lysidine(34) synthetase TilS [Hydrogenophilales bacterium 12-64-13]OYZ06168.1 MAG: tRNA lysidine(34) synthetase TilS [Hydrogenophilales bacterium 16-64-46]OZA38933.1 MAG: tRNA lysidine(34) synthetase TilS [Hydrogenophilales bacterium 17-64-34]